MATIICNNSAKKSVTFILNGGINILVFASQDGEYWFTVGRGYKTVNGAKRAAVKEMGRLGYTFDENEMKNLNID